jgi:hypothetical protein
MAALAALFLAACSPEYDWREIRSVEDGWSAMLPGKPAKLTRRIHLEAIEVPMTMQGAKIGETSFTVAVAELPDDGSETRQRALAAMRAGMLRNVGASEPRTRSVEIPMIDAGGAATGRLPAERVEAKGTVQGRPVTLLAGFAGQGRRAWQWVVIGPAADPEQADVFFEGFRVIGVPR